MLREKLAQLRQDGGEIFVCLCHSPQAQAEWLACGGAEGHILWEKQMESWLMLGGPQLPKETAFAGSLTEFIARFPKTEISQSKDLLNGFLQGAVLEFGEKGWECFTCQSVVMGCCMGEYLSVVNRKER